MSFRTVGAGAFSLVLIGIVANAVWFQRGHHPAPLFATGPTVTEPEPPPPLPTPRPTMENAGDKVPETPPAAAPADAGPPPAPAALPVKTLSTRPTASKLRHDDGIARLLLGQPLSSDTATMAEDKRPDAALLATQRQLVRLGYAVKPDGRMSGATRDAIEAFARKEHLPVERDAVTPALRRRIATVASASLDKAR